jgi:cytochrome P450
MIATPRLGWTPIFSRPEDVEQIFALDGIHLQGGAAQAPMVDFAGERSLMKLDGPEHREHREVLMGSLRPSDLPEGGSAIFATIRQAVAGWPVDRRFDLGAKLDRLALDLVAELVLDGVPEELLERAWQGMRTVRAASGPIGLLVGILKRGTGAHVGIVRQLAEHYVEARIAERESEPAKSPRCVFHRLMAGCPARGARLGPNDVRDETLTVLTAMLGGLSCSMKHAFLGILSSGGLQSRVRLATASAVAAGSPEGIASGSLLDSVCKEVLRLSPDIPFAVRQATTDVTIDRWRVPARTNIGIAIYLLHRRASTFPEPDRFLPDRFLSARPSRFEYLPFGGGRRGCVAAPLLLFLQKLILATVCERLHLTRCDRRENPVTSLSLVSTPARPIWVIAAPASTRATIAHGATQGRAKPRLFPLPSRQGNRS